MKQRISAAVGKGGVNRKEDVFVVQLLLNNWRVVPALGERMTVLALTGKCDEATVAAIGLFQQTILRFTRPDFRVDPDGKTFRGLIGPVTLQPSSADAPTTAMRADSHGDLRKTKFVWIHSCSGSETLEQIGHRYGYYLDYGAIAAFPLNPEFDDPRSTPVAGRRLFIPYPESFLRKKRRLMAAGLAEAAERTRALMAEVEFDQKNVEDYLLKIDLLAIAVTGTLSAAAAWGKYATQFGNATKVFGEATALTGEAAAKAMTKNSLLRFIPNILKKDDKWLELLIIMLDKAGSHAEIITTLIPSPKKPELGALYYLRHAFGPLNPSYYVQLFTAIGTGDYELWMFGTGALAYRDKKRIRDQFAEEERRVLRTIGMIDLQLSCHYYRNAALIALPL